MASALTGDPEQFFNFNGNAIKVNFLFKSLSRFIRFSIIGMSLALKILCELKS